MAVKFNITETREYDVDTAEDKIRTVEVSRKAGSPAEFKKAAQAYLQDKLGITLFELYERNLIYATEDTLRAQNLET